MQTRIFLGKVTMNSVNNNAGVFYGDNAPRGWRTHSKSNAGIGRINGDGNLITSRLNYLDDPDFFDLLVRSLR